MLEIKNAVVMDFFLKHNDWCVGAIRSSQLQKVLKMGHISLYIQRSAKIGTF